MTNADANVSESSHDVSVSQYRAPESWNRAGRLVEYASRGWMYLELDNPALPRSGQLFERVLDRCGDVEPPRSLGVFACPHSALTFAIECMALPDTPPRSCGTARRTSRVSAFEG